MTKATVLLGSFLLLAASILVKVHSPEWRDLFFYNGDSITLAMVMRSINEGELFSWVFSSQNFVFPEAVLYYVSYWVAGSYKNALIVNGVANLFLAIILFWYVCRLTLQNKENAWVAASIAALLFSLFLMMEMQPDINRKSIFTLTIFNTYYFGVILSSLLMIALFMKESILSGASKVLHLILFLFVGAFCYASDPLYLIQFAAPFLLVLTLMLFRGWKSNLRSYIKALTLIASSLAIGELVRAGLKQYTVASVNSYLKFDQIIVAFKAILDLVATLPSTPPYLMLWLAWLLLTLYVGYAFVEALIRFGVNQSCRGRTLFLGFCFMAPVVNIGCVILSGNSLTRYFVTLSIFPAIGFSFIVAEKIRRTNFLYILLLISSCIVLPAYANSKRNSSELSSYEKSLKCYQELVNIEKFHAVGSFWTSRYLDLYRATPFRTFQTLNDFRPYDWLSNRYNYEAYKITSVVVDKQQNPAHINEKDVEKLGPPSRIMSCENFYIYIYTEGTFGYNHLNSSMRSR